MNEGFQLKYDHFHFVIKTFIKLLDFFKIHLFNFYDTLIKSFLPRFLFFLRKLLCNCYHKF